jgi:hypothetical protein
MRITRTTAALALAVAAATAGTAHASNVSGAIGTVTGLTGVGNGGSSGIQDWYAVNRDLGNGHYAHFLCEYALEPDGTGHFEADAEALVNGTLTPSPDATDLRITCTYYGTPNGSPSFPLSASASANPAARSANGAAGRPTKICMTGSVTWANGDVASVTDLCQTRRLWVARDDLAKAAVGVDSGTDSILDGATGTAVGCTSPAGGCASRAQEFAHTTVRTVSNGYRPGVEVSVETPPAGR